MNGATPESAMDNVIYICECIVLKDQPILYNAKIMII